MTSLILAGYTSEAIATTTEDVILSFDEDTSLDLYTLTMSRIAYFALGLNIAIICHAYVTAFRVFKGQGLPFKLTMWGLTSAITSTLFSYGAAYWSEGNDSSTLTTFDGLVYVQMVIATFILYINRLKLLSTFPESDRYTKWIPYVVGFFLIPDDIIYVTSAWTTISDLVSQIDGALVGIIIMISSITIYAVLLKKMFGFLTVDKKKVSLKLFSIVGFLTVLDIFVLVLNFANTDLYNSIYSLSFSIKISFVVDLYDSDSWM